MNVYLSAGRRLGVHLLDRLVVAFAIRDSSRARLRIRF